MTVNITTPLCVYTACYALNLIIAGINGGNDKCRHYSDPGKDPKQQSNSNFKLKLVQWRYYQSIKGSNH
eukprot:CAMPEP_0117734964 /NCGR_PEP_ID=MMETSP0947-20121206/1001_1 /TAXON_ID=44440 /ORGANISM="Chattonella subsalsa, Strain CCMP2191" /LENGTH=68 /DNA_ID=CAMNT_0005549871 /DNA_START=924 /DNA_END=1130 /DNA_ORIENTATION=-